MPRTKRPVKRAEKSNDGDNVQFNRHLDKLLEQEKKRMDAWVETETRNVELAFKWLMKTINPKHLNMTVGQLKNEKYIRETNIDTESGGPSTDRRPASHDDDGYVTANSSHGSGDRGVSKIKAPSTSSRSGQRRSRSADASSRRPPAARSTQRRRSRSGYRTPAAYQTPAAAYQTPAAVYQTPAAVYQTPALNMNCPTAYPPITPKVAPQAALAVLRQPRLGEMVVSLTGSPVMVPTMQQTEKATCNIQLNDGTVLSLQPRELRQSQAYIPLTLMGPEALQQMRTIKENLDMMVRMGEQALK